MSYQRPPLMMKVRDESFVRELIEIIIMSLSLRYGALRPMTFQTRKACLTAHQPRYISAKRAATLVLATMHFARIKL